jgi:hypothetical protein
VFDTGVQVAGKKLENKVTVAEDRRAGTETEGSKQIGLEEKDIKPKIARHWGSECYTPVCVEVDTKGRTLSFYVGIGVEEQGQTAEKEKEQVQKEKGKENMGALAQTRTQSQTQTQEQTKMRYVAYVRDLPEEEVRFVLSAFIAAMGDGNGGCIRKVLVAPIETLSKDGEGAVQPEKEYSWERGDSKE